jgi:hypothetical protein
MLEPICLTPPSKYISDISTLEGDVEVKHVK